MKSLEGFFAQARSNLSAQSPTSAKLEQEWLSKVAVISATQPRVPPTIRPGVFEQVSDALYANRRLQLQYIHTDGKSSAWEVMPLALAQQGPRLYLVCRFPRCTDERTLAMHRIESAKALAETFERPKDFDLKQYDDDGRFAFGEGRQIRLSFLIDKELAVYLRESPLSLDQVMSEVRGKFKIMATVVDSKMLERWLLGFGGHVTEVRRRPLVRADGAVSAGSA
jgi:predicted DNA-binding transcriptional regulator YafY